jgi:hypothetical protein
MAMDAQTNEDQQMAQDRGVKHAQCALEHGSRGSVVKQQVYVILNATQA